MEIDYTVDWPEKYHLTDAMALRVLLADESTTIKKVIQLSLQDFGVDVKAVTIGLDVLSVAKSYRPDIVLADVLLAKRSGYEVCHDLKNDPDTADIPVVLMWSGFMEIDEQKARLCGADRRLEKPFDASALRQIVQDLATKTNSNPVSSFLQFPTLPPFDEPKLPKQPVAPQSAAPPPAQTKPTPQPIADDDALVIDDSEESSDEWVQQPINPKPQTPPPVQNFSIPQPGAPQAKLPQDDEFTEFSLTQHGVQKASAAPVPAAPQPAATSPQMPEAILREEIQKWLAKNMPEIAERLIREEINRLLQESEKTIQSP
jgi:CheY-like chemotaxis protein